MLKNLPRISWTLKKTNISNKMCVRDDCGDIETDVWTARCFHVEQFYFTWEVVQSCALADRRRELLFLKVVVKLGVDGLRGVGGALVRMSSIGTVRREERCE